MPDNRLLVIDDEPDVAATVGRVARRAGFDTIVTTDGADFLERAWSWEPTVMVLDLAMPDVDGREILAELARRSSKAHILIVSGFERPEIEEAMAAGRAAGLNMAGILEKPLRIDSLRAALRAIYDDAELISAEDTRAALERGEFFLHYQPKVSLRTLRPAGVEALARWRHPQRGLISPDSFIPVMEAGGVMDRFTPHVIGQAVAQARTWRDQNLDIGIAVNVSGGSFDRLRLDDIIGQRCREQGVDPACLTVEITETAAMVNVAEAIDGMRRLRAMGVRISIDDFGTGYSSLVQLHRLPFSEVKIDKSFVLDCDINPESQVIVRTIVSLAHNLGLKVVAEGVETAGISDQLLAAGCDIVQGYHYGRPMAADALGDWLRGFGRPARDIPARIGAAP